MEGEGTDEKREENKECDIIWSGWRQPNGRGERQTDKDTHKRKQTWWWWEKERWRWERILPFEKRVLMGYTPRVMLEWNKEGIHIYFLIIMRQRREEKEWNGLPFCLLFPLSHSCRPRPPLLLLLLSPSSSSFSLFSLISILFLVDLSPPPPTLPFLNERTSEGHNKKRREIYIHFQNQPEVRLNWSTTSAGAILLLCPSPTTTTHVSVTTGLVALKERERDYNRNDDRRKWMVWQSRGNLNFLSLFSLTASLTFNCRRQEEREENFNVNDNKIQVAI